YAQLVFISEVSKPTRTHYAYGRYYRVYERQVSKRGTAGDRPTAGRLTTRDWRLVRVFHQNLFIEFPLSFASCEDGDAVAVKVLVAVAKSFQVWPAPDEVLVVDISRDGNVWNEVRIVANDFFKQLLHGCFVYNVKIDR